jgi:outer membrane protein assembly factor BamB
VGTEAGEVISFSLRDGSQRWQQAVKGRVRSIGDSGDTIYVGTSEGIIYAFVPPRKEVRSIHVPVQTPGSNH